MESTKPKSGEQVHQPISRPQETDAVLAERESCELDVMRERAKWPARSEGYIALDRAASRIRARPSWATQITGGVTASAPDSTLGPGETVARSSGSLASPGGALTAEPTVPRTRDAAEARATKATERADLNEIVRHLKAQGEDSMADVLVAALPPPEAKEDDETFQGGITFALLQLCGWMDVEPASVSWDAATETVEGDVSAVIGNIMRAKMGEDWSPEAKDGWWRAAMTETVQIAKALLPQDQAKHFDEMIAEATADFFDHDKAVTWLGWMQGFLEARHLVPRDALRRINTEAKASVRPKQEGV